MPHKLRSWHHRILLVTWAGVNFGVRLSLKGLASNKDRKYMWRDMWEIGCPAAVTSAWPKTWWNAFIFPVTCWWQFWQCFSWKRLFVRLSCMTGASMSTGITSHLSQAEPTLYVPWRENLKFKLIKYPEMKNFNIKTGNPFLYTQYMTKF